MMDLARIPKAATATAVDLAVTTARLPLTIAERVLGKDVPLASPPARVATAAQAAVLRAFGAVLGDERLTGRAQLLTDALDRVAEADRLRAAAEQTRAEGEAKAEARLDEAENARRLAAEEADRRRAEIEARTEEAQEAIERRSAKRAEITAEAQERRERAARKSTRATRAEAVEARREAVEAKQEAVEADTVVETLDDELARAKARRRAAAS